MPPSLSLAQRSISVTSPRPASSFPLCNLGTQVKDVLKCVLPFNMQMVALVAQLVEEAWTLNLERVGWEEGEKGVRFELKEHVPKDMVLW